MARTDRDTQRKDDGPRAAAAFLARPFVLAVAVVLVLAAVLYVTGGDRRSDVIPQDTGTRPTGSGTLPGGAADAEIEGMESGTSPGDIIDNSSRSDNRPNILEAGEGPPPAATVDELDLPEQVDPSVIEPGPPPAQD